MADFKTYYNQIQFAQQPGFCGCVWQELERTEKNIFALCIGIDDEGYLVNGIFYAPKNSLMFTDLYLDWLLPKDPTTDFSPCWDTAAYCGTNKKEAKEDFKAYMHEFEEMKKASNGDLDSITW